jgi:hypothetical protein
MSRRAAVTGCSLTVCVLGLLSAGVAYGQWGPFTPPTGCSITSETFFEAEGLELDRQILGIGEMTDCILDDSDWEDLDCYADTTVYDSIGSKTWSLDGWGTVEGAGNGCIYTAPRLPPDQLPIDATVYLHDIGLKTASRAGLGPYNRA